MFHLTAFNRLLILFLLFIGAMIFARIIYTASLRYLFLVWNLFLAWLPYVISGLLMRFTNAPRYQRFILFVTWLLIFPNALYIITDLIHLQADSNMPVWYDAILLFASSFLGLVMAFTSMRRVERVMAKTYSKKAVAIFVPIVLTIGAFGVFLGRFLRWNSWDVINNPMALFNDVFSILFFPHHNMRTWFITALLSVLYCLIYFFMKHLQSALAEERPERL